MTNKPMTVTSRGVTVRDFAIFQVKLLLDGAKDFFAFWLSIIAITLDFIAGRGSRPRLFYSVVRASERFDKWINLHSVIQEMDASGTEDGLFGGSEAGADSLIGQIEMLVRGSEEERATALEQLKERSAEIKDRSGELADRVLDADAAGPGPRQGPAPPSDSS